MLCAACMRSVPDDVRFCPHCGARRGPGGLPARRGAVVAASGEFAPYAGFLRRALAHVIDNILLFFVGIGVAATTAVATTLLFGSHFQMTYSELRLLLYGIYYVTFGLIWLCYRWWSDASGRSVGKRVMGIRVVRLLDGAAPGWGTGLVRTLSRLLSVGAFGLGFLWALWDADKQTWHDKLADTVVVKS